MKFPKNENKNVIAVLVLLIITIITFLFFILRQELNERTDKPLYGKFYLEKRPYHATKVFKVHFFVKNKEVKVSKMALESFNELHKKACSSLEKKNLHEAMLYFHRAKMICPSSFETRVNLADTFTQMCLEKGRFCGNAQREIKNAFGFIKNIEEKKLEEKDIERLLKLKKAMKSYTYEYFQKPYK